MSSVAASPSVTAPDAVHVRRPSTLVAYRWELRKLVSQKRTYLGFGLAVALPLIFVVFQDVHPGHARGADTHFAAQITQSGLATPVLMLLFLSVFMLPLITALVAGTSSPPRTATAPCRRSSRARSTAVRSSQRRLWRQ
jgi:hypothetical protein